MTGEGTSLRVRCDGCGGLVPLQVAIDRGASVYCPPCAPTRLRPRATRAQPASARAERAADAVDIAVEVADVAVDCSPVAEIAEAIVSAVADAVS